MRLITPPSEHAKRNVHKPTLRSLDRQVSASASVTRQCIAQARLLVTIVQSHSASSVLGHRDRTGRSFLHDPTRAVSLWQTSFVRGFVFGRHGYRGWIDEALGARRDAVCERMDRDAR